MYYLIWLILMYFVAQSTFLSLVFFIVACLCASVAVYEAICWCIGSMHFILTGMDVVIGQCMSSTKSLYTDLHSIYDIIYSLYIHFFAIYSCSCFHFSFNFFFSLYIPFVLHVSLVRVLRTLPWAMLPVEMKTKRMRNTWDGNMFTTIGRTKRKAKGMGIEHKRIDLSYQQQQQQQHKHNEQNPNQH